ncbi:hypothetical protein LMG28688_04211 [Paraburkholderia caffeinitolerans]|uniref:Uncharacterized protein n=1 Tax=Paraburkholderia caffeinitolerans TaxID=1723730 RepID=A0A6J5G8U8_9BURK|nr:MULTISPECIES: hypothetical protein [Paraburkholderia]CAB3795987.1 hypothetical protein LMG28688_04211 [Paraburkholderia caffeinitolerans]
MGGLFAGAPRANAPTPQAAPKAQQPAESSADQAEAQARADAGFASTIKTGAQGVPLYQTKIGTTSLIGDSTVD